MGDPFHLNLPPMLALLALAIGCRIIWRSWWSPAPFFAAWIVLMFVLPICIVPWLPVWSVGLWVIAGFPFAFACGAAAVHAAEGRHPKGPRHPGAGPGSRHRPLEIFIVLLSAVGAAGLMPLISSFGPGASDSLAVLARYASITRYQGDFDPPLMTKIAWVAMFAAAAAAGEMLGRPHGRRQLLVAGLPFLVAIGYVLVLTTKLSIIIPLAFFVAAFLPTRVVFQGADDHLISPRTVRRAATGFLLIVVLFVVSLLLRYGYLSGDSMGSALKLLLIERFSGYIAGHVSAFSAWIDGGGLWDSQFTAGAYTLSGIYDLIGLSERIQGLYEATGRHAAIVDTNVFTAFRGLIQDFSLPFALLAFFMLGALVHLAYRHMAFGSQFGFAVVMVWNSFVLLVSIASIFTWNTSAAGLILYLAYRSLHSYRLRIA